jgi:hypothetical protein
MQEHAWRADIGPFEGSNYVNIRNEVVMQPSRFMSVLSFSLIISVGIDDYFTGYEVNVALLYRIPVLLAPLFGKKYRSLRCCS